MTLEDRLVRLLNRRPVRKPSPSDKHLQLGIAHALIGTEHHTCAWAWEPSQHTFVSGRTGSGKTTLLLRIMEEHLRVGVPFLFIDFHGQATEQLLAMVASAPKSRSVVLLEPWSDPVLGWNPLATDDDSPYAVVRELVAIFHRRLWPEAWGPRLEELLRNTLLALVEAKLTLVEATTWLGSPEFRRTVLQRVSLPEVREFWTVRFERLAPSQKAIVTETVLNKLSVFQDPVLKYVVGQQASTLDLDQVLRRGETLLVNLAVGPSRGQNFLLAALLVAAFKAAVYRRSSEARPYAIILDEFQEMVAVDALDDYLRSFRKFHCAVYLATQHLQLSPELKAAIFGNCHRFCCFATSAADATVLGKEFGSPEGELATEVLPELRTGQALVKVRGEPVRRLQVQTPRADPQPEQIGAGRARCLARGLTRRDLDREFSERTRPRGLPSRKLASELPSVPASRADALPEGYDDY